MRTMLRRDWGGSQPWPLSATMPLQPSGSPASHSLAAQTPQSGPASACRPPASSAAQSEMASSVSIPACTFAGNAGQSAYGYRQRHPAHAELQIPLQLHSQGSSSIDSSSQGYQNLAYMRTFVHVHNKYVRSAELVQWETQVPAWLWLHGVCMGRWACMAAWDLHGQVGLHGCMGFAWAGGPAWLHKVCMGSWTCMAAWRLHGQMGLHDCMESHVHHVQYFVPRTY